MKWITFLVNCNIKYYIYKLYKEDSIIIENNNHNAKTLVILCGSTYLIKYFANAEFLPIAILSKDNIFNIITSSSNQKFYYKLTAIEKTYIIAFPQCALNKKQKSHVNFLENIVKSYYKTLKKYEIMNEIINQKYLKNRTIQLLLSILLEFGIVKQNNIHIPFKVSNKNLAIMTGTNKTTISKIMKEIYKNLNIKYSSKKIMNIKNIFNIKFY
uniref:Global nitrogen transcriptional regulator n=1 Tax=Ophidocladus simpliciusculus TaxID=1261574 RepID=A0A1Z1MJZ2_9FLOR|nr:global nitrogen transcriptional regulator [Ophidocladus simpliciusculus]ARW66081.1 global nitrogen transcriptional regulator [Ophidocladus simpliciusculus]